MMDKDFFSKINKSLSSRKGSKVPSGEELFFKYFFVCAKEFGWSYNDFCETPLPVIVGVVDELREYYAEQERAIKKKR